MVDDPLGLGGCEVGESLGLACVGDGVVLDEAVVVGVGVPPALVPEPTARQAPQRAGDEAHDRGQRDGERDDGRHRHLAGAAAQVESRHGGQPRRARCPHGAPGWEDRAMTAPEAQPSIDGTRLTAERYLELLDSDLEALLAASTDLAADVPGCPGWTVRDLLSHVIGVYRHKSVALSTDAAPPEREAGWGELSADVDPCEVLREEYAVLRAHLVARDVDARDVDVVARRADRRVLGAPHGAGDRRAPVGRGERGVRRRRRGRDRPASSPTTGSTSCSAGCAGAGTTSRRTRRRASACWSPPASTRGRCSSTATVVGWRAAPARPLRCSPASPTAVLLDLWGRPGQDVATGGDTAALALLRERLADGRLLMPQPWDEVRGRDPRAALLDTSTLVRAVAAGRRRGVPLQWRRAELRPVALKGGVRLQVTAYDETQAHTSNHDAESAGAAVDALLEQGFGNWHVETADAVIQVRITKKGDAQVHRSVRGAPVEVAPATHDRVKRRLLRRRAPGRARVPHGGRRGRPPGHASSRAEQDKYIQVEEFVRLLDTAVEDARTAGALPDPTPENPWHLVDLGCGHAYLTVGAYVWLAKVRGLPVRRARRRRARVVRASATLRSPSRSGGATSSPSRPRPSPRRPIDPVPQVVVALHACDTATDDALARAVRWQAPVVLAAPCCHHDLQAQVARGSVPSPYAVVTRHGLLRERLVDVLTDAHPCVDPAARAATASTRSSS